MILQAEIVPPQRGIMKFIGMMKLTAILLVMAGVQLTAVAATLPIDITGKVTNDKGEPVAGASVTVKGTSRGTTTTTAGIFNLAGVADNAILVISGTNIETSEVKVAGKVVLDITVRIKMTGIDEVQVVGYGTTTKRMNTGTVATIKGTEIKDRPVTDVMQALQGKMTGVAITTSGPGLGAASKIMIRGINSISSGSNPLIIVDGVVVNEKTNSLVYTDPVNGGFITGNTYGGGISTLNYINPSDIESIDVLKDADATSIYGSRGTNGVILITTQKASMGKSRLTVNTATGWKSPTGLTKRMNTQQYLQMRKDAYAMGNMESPTSIINPITPTAIDAPDLLTWSQSDYTNYPKMELGNAAPNYSANVSASGGNKSLNFVASGAYSKMYDNYMFKPYQERANGNMQLNHTSANNKLSLHLGAIFGIESQKIASTNFITSGAPTAVNPPNFPLYKSDGSLNLGELSFSNFIFAGYNPLVASTVSARAKTNNTLLNGDLSYTIAKGLVAKLQASYNAQSNSTHSIFPSTAVNSQDPLNTIPNGQHSYYKFTSVNVEPQLSYNRSILKATITALAGATLQNQNTEAIYIRVNNPGSDDLLYSAAAGQPTITTTDNTEQKFRSAFGRLTMDWEKKYIANFSFRRDGSSRLGPDNRFANFGSAGFAWLFGNESFVKNNLSFVSFGKLRGSYGTTGSNNIPDYQYLGLLQVPDIYYYGAFPGYAFQSPLNIANYPNPDLAWEKTTKKDVGLELGFLQNRIMLSNTWYRSVSGNLLVTIPLPGQTGFTNYYGNFAGTVQNTGWEFELTTQNLAPNKVFKWNTRFNLTTNKNILKSFPGIEATPYASNYKVGRAIPSSAFLVETAYQFTGIDAATGLPQFKDVNNDGVIDYLDRFGNDAWVGTSLPTVWGGLTNTLSYKGFTLDVFLQYSNGIFSKWNFGEAGYLGGIYNPAADMAGNYWTKPGDVKKYPRLYTGVATGSADYTDPLTQYYPNSTANLYKGYYIRLKNLQLSYSIPAHLLSKIKAGSATVYISGENLAVYTPEKLFKDPEVTGMGSSNSLLRTITTGIRIEF